MTRAQLVRIRWAVRAVLFLGVAVSVTANILHAVVNPISQAIAAWPPIALLLTVELISRIPVHRRSLAFARLAATAIIAGIAAWVSYWHMAGVASRYGETGASPYLMPVSVDGLVVVASICLVELAGRIRETGRQSVPVVSTPGHPVDGVDQPAHDPPAEPEPAPGQADKLSGSKPPTRKAHASARDRVERAHKRTPDATHQELAGRLKLSSRTVERWRPSKPAEAAAVNGREPEFAGAVVASGSDKEK